MKCSPIGRFANSYISTPKAHSTKLKTAWGPYITRCGPPQWWGLGGMPCSDRLRRLAAPAGALRPRRLQSSARHASQAPYLTSIASNSPQTEGAHTAAKSRSRPRYLPILGGTPLLVLQQPISDKPASTLRMTCSNRMTLSTSRTPRLQRRLA